MNRFMLIFFSLLLMVLGSCKKEADTTASEVSYVKVVVDQTEYDIATLILNASVISPKRVNMVRQVFITTTTDNITQEYEVAQQDIKMGSVSLRVPNLVGKTLINEKTTFYIELEDGTIISSQPISTPTIIPTNPTFSQSSFTINDPLNGNLNMVIDLNEYDITKYTFVTYGFEFADQVSYNPNGFSYQGQNTNLSVSNTAANVGKQTLTITLQANIHIYDGLPYGGKFYAVFIDNMTTQNYLIESTPIVFIGPPKP